MKYKFSKNYIKKMQELSKDKIILYTTEKASWRNFWLLFRSGRKTVEKVNLVIGYKEYAAGTRSNYWVYQDGAGWISSTTHRPVTPPKQKLFDALQTNHTGIEIEIKTDK